ncbi:MAG: TlpA disulfide reductase family protein [Pseudomonadota bacterium]
MKTRNPYAAWLCAFALAACAHPMARAVVVGKTAPALEAKLITSEAFKLRDQLGKVVIINFWASWCAPCRQEMPALETYYRQHENEGLRVLAISMDDAQDHAAVREVMRAFSFPAAFERDADYAGYGRIWRMPMTFIIDRQGILRRDGSVGEPTVDLPTLERLVTPLLGASAAPAQ